jgi:transcriptional regulator with XRE-family HTH domain
MTFTLVRTPGQLKAAREKLGLSTENLARVLRVEDGRTVRRWEAGDREIPGPVIVVMETIMGNVASIEMIDRQLEMLQIGKYKLRRGSVDQSAEDFTRLKKQRSELKSALALLLRQPDAEGNANDRVHWYELRRSTPKFQPPEKDDWTMPGELSPEAALFYFVKHEHVAPGLELCEDDQLSSFKLYQRELHRSEHGASVRLSPGRVIKTFAVREVELPPLR